MTVFRPDDYRSNGSYRVDPLQGKRNDDEDAGEKKKKKVAYQGRSWSEKDEDLPVQPPPPPKEPKAKNVYADQALLEKAEKQLTRFPTLEEKVGALCFLQTEAHYDLEGQNSIERLLQLWQLGGLLFVAGEFRRQSYLIERYQGIAKTPLLIGNDFLHGLSFYFQGQIPVESIEKMDERRSSDLGKAVVFQNRRLGVHFQFDRELKEKEGVFLNDAQARSFRNGIREAHGIVGKERQKNAKHSHSAKMSQAAPFLATITATDQVQEAFGLRTINFLDLTHLDSSVSLEEKILEGFAGSYDAFLLSERTEEILQLIVKAVLTGKIKESDLERKLIKILLLKMNLFPLR